MTDAELDALEAKLPSNAVYSDTRGWLAATALDLIADLRESRARIAELEAIIAEWNGRASIERGSALRTLLGKTEARIAELEAAIRAALARLGHRCNNDWVRGFQNHRDYCTVCPTEVILEAALSTHSEST